MRSEAPGTHVADQNVCGAIHIKKTTRFRIWILEEFDDFSIVNKNGDVMQISNVMYIKVATLNNKALQIDPICQHMLHYIELTITKLQDFTGPQTHLPEVIHFWSYYRLARGLSMFIREHTPIQLEYGSLLKEMSCFRSLVISYSKAALSYIVPIYSSDCPIGMLKVNYLYKACHLYKCIFVS